MSLAETILFKINSDKLMDRNFPKTKGKQTKVYLIKFKFIQLGQSRTFALYGHRWTLFIR